MLLSHFVSKNDLGSLYTNTRDEDDMFLQPAHIPWTGNRARIALTGDSIEVSLSVIKNIAEHYKEKGEGTIAYGGILGTREGSAMIMNDTFRVYPAPDAFNNWFEDEERFCRLLFLTYVIHFVHYLVYIH